MEFLHDVRKQEARKTCHNRIIKQAHTSVHKLTVLFSLFRHQDTYSQACCAAITCEAWIGLRIDLLSMVFLSIVVFGAHLMNLEPGK